VQASPGPTWRWTRPVPPLLWPPMRQLTWWWGRCADKNDGFNRAPKHVNHTKDIHDMNLK
jgi:hypothetical protein